MNEHTRIAAAAPLLSSQTGRRAAARRSDYLARDCSGENFFAIDRGLQDLLTLYMPEETRTQITPHLARLGGVAGGRLNDLADLADKHTPVLHSRDKYGRDEEWLEVHPAYREIQDIAFRQFGLHAMTHRAGVLGLDKPHSALTKQVFHYLFAQAEFGVLCPVNLTDSSSELIRRYGTEEVKARFLEGMWSQDMDRLLKGAQFMTEKVGGSDAGAAELVAVPEGDHWRLYGEKWFCSNVDADVSVLLARPEGAVAGGKGLGLFVMPKTLDDGTRNAYRILRLKDKLGSKSMPSGEIVFEGALAWHLGDIDRGMKQMLEMVNSSRISHLARAAGMMRRCLNEALAASGHRRAFGRTVSDFPLMRRQLMKMMVLTEQSLSALMFAATLYGDESPAARKLLRITTPVVKYRACRDNVLIATAAMEARGGNGYIEDWPNARLVRDAHLGLIWEGTSSVNALDVIQRAVAKERAHEALRDDLADRLRKASGVPGQFRTRIEGAVAQAFQFAAEVAGSPDYERFSRVAAGGLYHALTAVLLLTEGLALGAAGRDSRRALLARFVLEHRLTERSKYSLGGKWETEAEALLLDQAPVPLDRTIGLLVA